MQRFDQGKTSAGWPRKTKTAPAERKKPGLAKSENELKQNRDGMLPSRAGKACGKVERKERYDSARKLKKRLTQ